MSGAAVWGGAAWTCARHVLAHPLERLPKVPFALNSSAWEPHRRIRSKAADPGRMPATAQGKPLPMPDNRAVRPSVFPSKRRKAFAATLSTSHGLQHQAGQPRAVSSQCITEHRHEHAHRSQTRVKCAGDHGCTGGTADIGL